MSLTLYNNSKSKSNEISSEISTNNILNYKRRSNLVSKNYSYETNKTSIDTIETLQNCYDSLCDMKNIMTDYLKDPYFNTINIKNTLEKYKIEIISTLNIIYNNKKKYSREENKILKKINYVVQVIQLLYNDIKKTINITI
jgi:hypothetical protein